MNIQAFCYLGLLRFPEQLEPSLALLPEAERAEAAKLLEAARNLPRSEILRRWSKLRLEEYVVLCRRTRELTGIHLDELAPALREWCASWLAGQNG